MLPVGRDNRRRRLRTCEEGKRNQTARIIPRSASASDGQETPIEGSMVARDGRSRLSGLCQGAVGRGERPHGQRRSAGPRRQFNNRGTTEGTEPTFASQ